MTENMLIYSKPTQDHKDCSFIMMYA